MSTRRKAGRPTQGPEKMIPKTVYLTREQVTIAERAGNGHAGAGIRAIIDAWAKQHGGLTD